MAKNHVNNVVFGIRAAKKHANYVVFGTLTAKNHANYVVFGIPAAKHHLNVPRLGKYRGLGHLGTLLAPPAALGGFLVLPGLPPAASWDLLGAPWASWEAPTTDNKLLDLGPQVWGPAAVAEPLEYVYMCMCVYVYMYI